MNNREQHSYFVIRKGVFYTSDKGSIFVIHKLCFIAMPFFSLISSLRNTNYETNDQAKGLRTTNHEDLFKGLTAVSAGRSYRFEHIDTYSSGKVVAK